MFLRACATTSVVLAIAWSGIARAQAAQPVVGFVVRGDSKLTSATLGHLAHVDLGDPLTADDLPRIKQDLISSELFEKVEVTLEPAAGGVALVATLDDKHSWIIAPTLYWAPGGRAAGVGFVENNLGGRNEKLLLFGQIGERESILFGTYHDPRVRGTALSYRFDLYGYRRVKNEFANPAGDPTSKEILRTSTTDYLGAGAQIGWAIRWWLVTDFRLRGAYVRYHDVHAPDGTPLPAPQTDGWDVTATARLTLDRRDHHFGVRWGPYVQLHLETTIPGLDDYGYSVAAVRAFYSWVFFAAHMLELRTSGAVARHMPFQTELALGSSVDLRGYSFEQFRGDTRAVFRAEYSVPLVKWRSFAFRALGFWDTGWVGFYFPRPGGDRDYLSPAQDRGASWWRNDVGVGVRLYIKSIVLPLLGLDVAYGIEGRSPEVWFQLGLTDF